MTPQRTLACCALLLAVVAGCDNDRSYRAEVTIETEDASQDTSNGGGGQADASALDTTQASDTTSTEDTTTNQDTTSDRDTTSPPDTATTDTTAPLDAPPVSDAVTLRVINDGEVAAYLEPIHKETSYRGLSVYQLDAAGERRRLSLGPVCETECSECVEIACEAPTPASFQLLPGASWEFTWDGSYIAHDSCVTERDTTWSCYNWLQATPGVYVAEVCYAATFRALGDSARRDIDGEDVLQAVEWIDPVCVERTFEFGADEEIELRVTPEATPEDKPFGFCGPAWTWSWSPPGAVFRPERAQRGASVPFTSGSFGGPVASCLAPGYTTAPALSPGDPSGVVFATWATTWTGTMACAPSEPLGNVHLIPSMEIQNEQLGLQISGAQGGPREAVQLTPCPDCSDGAGERPLGEPCRGDSDCADPGAFCDLRTATECDPAGVCEGVCALDCRSNRDCPGNWLCAPLPSDEPVTGRRCTPQAEDACRADYECDPGQRCASDGNAFARCMPDFDTRGLTNGRGALCGCDAECPGAQSCVRMELNFTDGFCAFRCRDDRDCPTSWSCLGETSSGLGSICVP